MKKPYLTILILIFLVGVLSVVRIYISNNISTSGQLLGKAEEEINSLKLQNTLLSEKLYQQSSLTFVFSKAKDLGYTDSKTDFVLDNKLPVAIKQ